MTNNQNSVTSNKKKLSLANILFWTVTIVFILSLIPIFYLAPYDAPAGDDYGYTASIHLAMMHGKGLVGVIKALISQVSLSYRTWQGTWMSLIFFQLQPTAFDIHAYPMTPYIALLATILPMILFMKRLLMRVFGFDKRGTISITLFMLMIMLQFVYSPRSAIFWYNGVAHYVFALGLALLGLRSAIGYALDFKRGQLISAAVFFALLGGMSYPAALMAGMLLVTIITAYYIYPGKREGRRILLLIIPLVLEGIGLIISAKAPGNAIRGGENYDTGLAKCFISVGRSIVLGCQYIADMINGNPVILAMLIVAAVIVIYVVYNTDSEFSYPLPGLFVLVFFLTYCATFWPTEVVDASIYDVSGGVPNTVFQVLVLMFVFTVIYTAGYVKRLLLNRAFLAHNYHGEHLMLAGLAVMLLISALITIRYRSRIKASVDYQIYEYVSSGQAADYKDQVSRAYEILLDTSEPNVVIPAMNDDQGPLMCMPVTDDPDNFTNYVTARYFEKESVLSFNE